MRKFGLIAVLLGVGDAFHLVPRMWALNTTGLAANAAALGFGKLVTSITMTVFYLMLYHIWRLRYRVQGKGGLTVLLWALAGVRVILCLLPQNDWFSADAPLLWGVLRNIPFVFIGAIIIVLFFGSARKAGDKPFRLMWLAITLSFALYIPVVLWANAIPMLGMLMIPKTIAYVWIIWMGFADMRKEQKK